MPSRGITRCYERPQIGNIVVIDRCGHAHDEGIAGTKALFVAAEHQRDFLQFLRQDFPRPIVTGNQFGDASVVGVETCAGEFSGKRQC